MLLYVFECSSLGDGLSESDEDVSLYLSFSLSPGHPCAAMTIFCLIEDKGGSSEPGRLLQCYSQMQSSRTMTALRTVFGRSYDMLLCVDPIRQQETLTSIEPAMNRANQIEGMSLSASWL